MKILVVASTFPRWPGDTDPTFVYELSARLTEDDTEVHVLAPHTRGARTREQLDSLVVHRFRYFFERWETLAYGSGILDKLRANPFNYLLVPFFLTGMAFTVYRLVRKERFTVVHAHWLIPQGFACAAALRLIRNAPHLVCTSHGGDLFGLRGFLPSAIKRWVIARSHRLTVVSNYMRDYLRVSLAPDSEPRVLSMGVDMQRRFVPMPEVARAANELIFVGRLVEKKGVTYLLQALAQVRQTLPDVHLTIVGDGPLREGLVEESERLGLANSVSFRGSVTQAELPRLYCGASAAIVPSIVAGSGDQEGLGLVTVEALACGCAVIASDLPAIRDVVEHGRNGLLAAPADAQAIADQILRLLQDETQLEHFQTVARQSVIDKFDWAAVAASYRDVLQEAAHGLARDG